MRRRGRRGLQYNNKLYSTQEQEIINIKEIINKQEAESQSLSERCVVAKLLQKCRPAPVRRLLPSLLSFLVIVMDSDSALGFISIRMMRRVKMTGRRKQLEETEGEEEKIELVLISISILICF